MTAEIQRAREGSGRWYAIRAYNSETEYGFGTADEAERYVALRNRHRTINHYNAAPVTDAVLLGRLDDDGAHGGSMGFTLCDALASSEEA